MSIAKTIHFGGPDANLGGYTALYMVLSSLGLGLLAVNRVGTDPPYLWAVGMISCLVYGIVIISGEFVPPVLPPGVPNSFGNRHVWFWTNVSSASGGWESLRAGVVIKLVAFVFVLARY